MMFRIKYLLGIIAGVFGLLYSFVALIGWNDVLTMTDRYMALLLAVVHSIASLVLFSLSYREHKREVLQMQKVIASLMEKHSSFTIKELADAAHLSEGEMQDYLQSASHTKNMVVVKSPDKRNIRVYAAHTLN